MMQKGHTAAILAAQAGHTEIIDVLLECKEVDWNVRSIHGDSALMWASCKGHLEIVDRILERKEVEINVQSKVICVCV